VLETLGGKRTPTPRRKHTRIPIALPAKIRGRCRARRRPGRPARDQRQRRAPRRVGSTAAGDRGGARADPARWDAADGHLRARALTTRARIRPGSSSCSARAAARAGCVSWCVASRRPDPRADSRHGSEPSHPSCARAYAPSRVGNLTRRSGEFGSWGPADFWFRSRRGELNKLSHLIERTRPCRGLAVPPPRLPIGTVRRRSLSHPELRALGGGDRPLPGHRQPGGAAVLAAGAVRRPRRARGAGRRPGQGGPACSTRT
jgi:hypothetical protein